MAGVQQLICGVTHALCARARLFEGARVELEACARLLLLISDAHKIGNRNKNSAGPRFPP